MTDHTMRLFGLLQQATEPYARLSTAVLNGMPAWINQSLNTLHEIGEEIKREVLERRIADCAEGGKIAVIESGRDCDCVEYDGRVRIIDATREAFEALDDDIAQWADGPYQLRIERPSAAKSVEYHSRDLALEAHEDGHPHHIVSRFG